MTTKTNMPAFDVLSVKGGEGRNYYTRIGAAWPAKNGDGFNIELEALPLTGTLLLRPRKTKDNAEGENGGAQ
jgi:hypothetical protein